MHTPQVQSVSRPCTVGTYDSIREEKCCHCHMQTTDTQRNKCDTCFRGATSQALIYMLERYMSSSPIAIVAIPLSY